MQQDLISLMQQLAPDLADEMARRALVLERIADLQPIGRRQLAARLNLPEREIRGAAQHLRDEGLIDLNGSGMVLTEKAATILDAARSFSQVMRGLTDLENAVSSAYGIDRVYICSGDCDTDPQVFQAIGRTAAQHLRQVLHSGSTLAVSGGSTIAAVAKAIPAGTPMNVMVVPARGGVGRTVQTQANTMAAEIAQRLGGHHRLLHLPDQLDAAALQEMLRLP